MLETLQVPVLIFRPHEGRSEVFRVTEVSLSRVGSCLEGVPAVQREGLLGSPGIPPMCPIFGGPVTCLHSLVGTQTPSF